MKFAHAVSLAPLWLHVTSTRCVVSAATSRVTHRTVPDAEPSRLPEAHVTVTVTSVAAATLRLAVRDTPDEGVIVALVGRRGARRPRRGHGEPRRDHGRSLADTGSRLRIREAADCHRGHVGFEPDQQHETAGAALTASGHLDRVCARGRLKPLMRLSRPSPPESSLEPTTVPSPSVTNT